MPILQTDNLKDSANNNKNETIKIIIEPIFPKIWLIKVCNALPIIPEYLSNDKKEVRTDIQIENAVILVASNIPFLFLT